MESNKPASAFAVAIMGGILAYAITNNPWMFVVGFLGCFIAVLINLVFLSAARPSNSSNLAPKTYEGMVDAISYTGKRPVLEPVIHED